MAFTKYLQRIIEQSNFKNFVITICIIFYGKYKGEFIKIIKYMYKQNNNNNLFLLIFKCFELTKKLKLPAVIKKMLKKVIINKNIPKINPLSITNNYHCASFHCQLNYQNDTWFSHLALNQEPKKTGSKEEEKEKNEGQQSMKKVRSDTENVAMQKLEERENLTQKESKKL